MKLQSLPVLAALLALLAPAARASEVTLPAGYAPVNLVTNVGGSASSDTKCLNGDNTYGVSKAFDKKYYSDNTRWIGHGSTFPQRAVWTFPTPTIVDTVRIYNANYRGARQSPSDFTFAGSNDGSSWTTLDTESGVTGWSANQFRTFQFANRTAYLKYRLEVTAVQDMTSSEGNRMTITEIELYRVDQASFDVVPSGSPTIGIDSFSTDWILVVEEGSTADAGLVWSTDETFATATTNSIGTDLADGTHTATLAGLEPETTYWWKIFATNATDSAETAPSSFKTTGAPVFGTCTATADGNAAAFSIAIAEPALGGTLPAAVSVQCGTDGETWTALPLGSAATAATLTGSLEGLDFGTTYRWFALATATMEGGRVLSASTPTNSFTTLWGGEMYATNGNANAEPPYATWETAAPDIATAIALATDGATIHVADGTYSISTTLSVSKGVRVVGNDADPSRVVVRNTKDVSWNGGKNHRCITINHAAAVVSGITFENGKDYADGGNLRIDANGGMATNCILRNGFTREDGASGGANVAIKGPGIVTHCKIFGGSQNNCTDGDRVSSAYLEHANARIENCLVDGFNGATVATQPTKGCGGIVVNKGAAVNCTVVNCRSPYTTASGFAGILVWTGGVATNCVSVSNADSNGTVRAFAPAHVSRTSHCAFDAIEGEAVVPEAMPFGVVGTPEAFFPHCAENVPDEIRYLPKTGGPLYSKGANYAPMALYDLSGKQRRLIDNWVDIG